MGILITENAWKIGTSIFIFYFDVVVFLLLLTFTSLSEVLGLSVFSRFVETLRQLSYNLRNTYGLGVRSEELESVVIQSDMCTSWISRLQVAK